MSPQKYVVQWSDGYGHVLSQGYTTLRWALHAYDALADAGAHGRIVNDLQLLEELDVMAAREALDAIDHPTEA